MGKANAKKTTTAAKPKVKRPARDAEGAEENRRQVLEGIYLNRDARLAVVSRMKGGFDLIDEDMSAEDYAGVKAELAGALLLVEAMDALREKLDRPVTTWRELQKERQEANAAHLAETTRKKGG